MSHFDILQWKRRSLYTSMFFIGHLVLCISEKHAGLNASRKPISRLGTNFCLDCLTNRIVMERERERESDIVSRRENNILNDISTLDCYYLSIKEEYSNLNLMNEYLEEKLRIETFR